MICLWCGKNHRKPVRHPKCKRLSRAASQALKAGVPVWALFAALRRFGQVLLLEPEHFNARMELWAKEYRTGNRGGSRG